MQHKKPGNVYIVTSELFVGNTYKIGRWKNTNKKLISKYKTPYGTPINDLFRNTMNYILAETFTHKLLNKYRYKRSELFIGPIELFKCVANNVCNHIDRNIITDISNIVKYQDIVNDINNATTDAHFKELQVKFDQMCIDHTTVIVETLTDTEIKTNTEVEVKTKTKAGFVCNKCYKPYKYMSDFKRHINRKMPCDKKIKYQCRKCNKILRDKTDYTRHMTKKNPCKPKIPVDLDKQIKLLELQIELKKLSINNQ